MSNFLMAAWSRNGSGGTDWSNRASVSHILTASCIQSMRPMTLFRELAEGLGLAWLGSIYCKMRYGCIGDRER